jgi:hypothetical protein
MKDFLRADRLKHFIIGDAIAFFSMLILLAFFNLRLWEVCLLGFMFVLIIAFAKEAWDGGTKGNFFDRVDLKATVFGSIFAIVKILVTTLIF